MQQARKQTPTRDWPVRMRPDRVRAHARLGGVKVRVDMDDNAPNSTQYRVLFTVPIRALPVVCSSCGMNRCAAVKR